MPEMSSRSQIDAIFAALDQLHFRSGLPLSIKAHEMSQLSSEELFTLTSLSGPLLTWRGRLCYEYSDQLKETTLDPAWIIYAADEYKISAELASAANFLYETGDLVALPSVHFPQILDSFGDRLTELSKGASDNYQMLRKVYDRLDGVTELAVSPIIERRQYQSGFSTKLSLPLLVNCTTNSYSIFLEEFKDELTRLRHALKNLFNQSQSITHEKNFHEIVSEIDYQIAKLNDSYKLAVRDRTISGAGIIVGTIVTALSFTIPPELQPYLFSLGAPSTVLAGLKWLGQNPSANCRSSDYYLAWKFKTS